MYVLIFSLASDEDVVDTAEAETMQKTVDEAQEGLGGIPLAERHSEKFKRAERGSDCSFWDVFRYLVVCTHKLNSRKDCHATMG